MAKTETLIIAYTDADDNQVWLKGTTSAAQTWSPVISGIPNGAKIMSVTLSFANGYTYDKPGRTSVYWGTSTNGDRLWSTSGSGDGSTYTVDLTSRITGNGMVSLYFYKTANTGNTNSNVYFSGVKITIVYEKTVNFYRAENNQLVPYKFYRAENGVLVPYNLFYAAENQEIVTQNLLTADGEPLHTSDSKQFKVLGET